MTQDRWQWVVLRVWLMLWAKEPIKQKKVECHDVLSAVDKTSQCLPSFCTFSSTLFSVENTPWHCTFWAVWLALQLIKSATLMPKMKQIWRKSVNSAPVNSGPPCNISSFKSGLRVLQHKVREQEVASFWVIGGLFFEDWKSHKY